MAENRRFGTAAEWGVGLSIGWVPLVVQDGFTVSSPDQPTEEILPLLPNDEEKRPGRTLLAAVLNFRRPVRQALVESSWQIGARHYLAGQQLGLEDERVVFLDGENKLLLNQLSKKELRLVSKLADEWLSDPLKPLLFARQLGSMSITSLFLDNYNPLN
ncbi:MAG: hypothetical protein ACREF5_00580 [Candidatus Saccharimonadales bacterium]